MKRNDELQLKLLEYLEFAKPIRQAVENIEGFTRDEVIDMKDALLKTGFIQTIPGMSTSGTMYRTTYRGRMQAKQLKAETA